MVDSAFVNVDSAELLLRRRVNQQLAGTRFREPQEIVGWLGAMQAQEYAMTKWSIGLRLPQSTDASVEAAVNQGLILRTHVLRPTWHFVTPADIRWMLELTAPRVRAFMAYNDRLIGMSRPLFRRLNSIFRKALRGGNQLTRAALHAEALRAKIPLSGQQLAHALMQAELDGLICSGPRQGKHFTYALLDERVPATKPKTRDAALAELARRYFASRGPATAHDFAWWSGLTVADAKAGIASLGPEFAHETIDGRNHVFSARAIPTRSQQTSSATFLMPDYDEYGIAYKDRSALFGGDRGTGPRQNAELAYNRMIVIDGKIEGTWRRTETKSDFIIGVVPFAPLGKTKRAALTKAAQRLGKFFDRKARLVERQ
ncbi:MAG TPA: winged helix DNA-binding domain-containing protein [Opitutaceae bacterium]|nr:winged helix DNA-binding domain-containing protein [Opitutaceae bacterium]